MGDVAPNVETSTEAAVGSEDLREEQDERSPAMVADVQSPTPQEWMRHCITHIPCRPWCRYCMAGKGRTRRHRRCRVDRQNEVPVISMDYAALGPRGDIMDGDGVEGDRAHKQLVPFLILEDRISKCIASIAIPSKGASDPYVRSKCIKYIEEWGRTAIVLKCDQENSIKDLRRSIADARIHNTIREDSPKEDHQANGEAEAAVNVVGGQVRTMRAALQGNLGVTLDYRTPALRWMIDYAGVLLTRFQVGEDGRTGYERLKGRRFRKEIVEFGEQVMYEVRPGARKGKLEAKFEIGTYLGLATNSHEAYVADEAGMVHTTKTIKRRPVEERWNAQAVMAVKSLPWDLRPEDPEEDNGEDQEAHQDDNIGEEDQEKHQEGQIEPPSEPEKKRPRSWYITKQLLNKHGFTDGCPGCHAVRTAQYSREHLETCKARIEQAIIQDGDPSGVLLGSAERNMDYDAWLVDQGSRAKVRKTIPGPRAESSVGRAIAEPVQTSSSSGSLSSSTTRRRETLEHDGPQGEASDGKRRRLQAGEGSAAALVAAVDERLGGARVDVAEIYSPPRVTAQAWRMGLRPGNAYDLTVMNEDGEFWDFTKPEHRAKCWKELEKDKPWLVVGSPMCTAYCQLQALSLHKRSPEDVQRMMVRANLHLEFCVAVYRRQLQSGRYFLHEHPDQAKSWRYPAMLALAGEEGVLRLVGHMCPHGMRSKDASGEGLVLKPTGWLTNSREIGHEVAARCSNLEKEYWQEKHRHVQLVSGRAKACQQYPTALCEAILRGLVKQLHVDGRLDAHAPGLVCQVAENMTHPHEDDEADAYPEHAEFQDDVTGLRLDSSKVLAARRLELDFIDRKPLYTEVDESECMEVTGKRPITTRWVDIDKGGGEYRSRWVAREFKTDVTSEYFAATPPWEAVKLLVSLLASQGAGSSSPGRSSRRRTLRDVAAVRRMLEGGGVKLDLIDIKRAHFNARPPKPTYVQLPEERRKPGRCARLQYNLYGTRAAAQAWEEHYSGKLVDAGIRPGRTCPCIFCHDDKAVLVVVHGDDFHILGREADLDWTKGILLQNYELTHRARLGFESGDDKSARVLNRIVTMEDEQIIIEADQRHVEIVVRELGLDEAKGVRTPGIKDPPTSEEIDEALGPAEAKRFRSVAARLNFLASDRPDVQYCVKEGCREMARPTRKSWCGLKRVARYLVNAPRLVQRFARQDLPNEIQAWADSDFAGCGRTRKSTSGGAIRMGSHVLRTWSSTQAVISMSSGEAEFYALLKAASLGLGARSLVEDLGLAMEVGLRTDSSAAKGTALKRGLGKAKHIDTCYLWLQERVANREVWVHKVRTDGNLADLMTKRLDAGRHEELVQALGLEARAGRHWLAPPLAACA